MEKIIRYRAGKLDFIAPLVAKEFFSVIRSTPRTRTKQWYSQEQWNEAVCGHEIVPKEEETLIEFRKLWDDYSKEDIAAAGQARFEDIIADLKQALDASGKPSLKAVS